MAKPPRSRRARSRRGKPRQRPQAMGAPATFPLSTQHRFTRWAQFGNISSSTSVFTNFAWSFRLSDLPNFGEFTALFDQYRILAVELLFVPAATETVSSSQINGCFYAVIDYDDASLLSVNTDYLQYDSFKESLLPVSGTDIKRIRLRPRIATAVYGGGLATSYANTSDWIDVASPNVEHYGIKVGLSATPTTTITYQVVARYSLVFAHAR